MSFDDLLIISILISMIIGGVLAWLWWGDEVKCQRKKINQHQHRELILLLELARAYESLARLQKAMHVDFTHTTGELAQVNAKIQALKNELSIYGRKKK